MSPDRADHPSQRPVEGARDAIAAAAAREASRGANAASVTTDNARPGGLAMLAGLLLAPTAWFAQTNLGQTVSAWACFPHERPVRAPALPWLMHGLLVLSVATFIAGLAGFAIACHNWRRTAPLATVEARREPPHRSAARDCFLARVGTISSGVFLFGLIAADMAQLIVSPCGG